MKKYTIKYEADYMNKKWMQVNVSTEYTTSWGLLANILYNIQMNRMDRTIDHKMYSIYGREGSCTMQSDIYDKIKYYEIYRKNEYSHKDIYRFKLVMTVE